MKTVTLTLEALIDATFEALRGAHTHLLQPPLLDAIEIYWEKWETAKSRDFVESMFPEVLHQFAEASKVMGDHCLWNKCGPGYESLELLKAIEERNKKQEQEALAQGRADVARKKARKI